MTRAPFAIRHLPSAICHLPFAICHLPSALCHLPFAICHLPSAAPFHVTCHPSRQLASPKCNEGASAATAVHLFAALVAKTFDHTGEEGNQVARVGLDDI